ncbi:hypothetical protein GXW84_40400 [Rhodococcus sp. IEGM 248]|nr:hypothetical protein [Rhodococcus sp. IEGM 248]
MDEIDTSKVQALSRRRGGPHNPDLVHDAELHQLAQAPAPAGGIDPIYRFVWQER